MRISVLGSLLASAGLVAASAVAGAAPQWAPSHVIEATSATDGTRVVTAAVIDLKMCYEAQMQPWTKMKYSYAAMEARIPGTEHKICGQGIRKVVISIAESGAPTSVGLHTADGDQKLSVSKSGAIVSY